MLISALHISGYGTPSASGAPSVLLAGMRHVFVVPEFVQSSVSPKFVCTTSKSGVYVDGSPSKVKSMTATDSYRNSIFKKPTDFDLINRVTSAWLLFLDISWHLDWLPLCS
jgi:uncharacterized protein YqfA (UPF0365 family)